MQCGIIFATPSTTSQKEQRDQLKPRLDPRCHVFHMEHKKSTTPLSSQASMKQKSVSAFFAAKPKAQAITGSPTKAKSGKSCLP